MRLAERSVFIFDLIFDDSRMSRRIYKKQQKF